MSSIANAQELKSLNEVRREDSLNNGQTIIYGNFIQRLGFTSGGFPQDIRLIDINTNEVVSFRVKPTFKSAKENAFIYFIKPGNYAILNYWWTQSKWYGGKMFTEQIFKNVDASEGLDEKIKAGEINLNELKKFTFTIQPNSINYLGTWHFDKGLVSFTDDKTKHDNLVKTKYTNLDFTIAKTVLPN
jgi:hypothetical protein